jgi:hypothetical protein
MPRRRAARLYADLVEPREAVNPGDYRRPSIPEWIIGFDLMARGESLQ